MSQISTGDATDHHSPNFRFPIALSPSLLRFILLDVMFQIDQQLDIVRAYTCRSQVLPAMGCVYDSKLSQRMAPAGSTQISWPVDISPQQQGFHARHDPAYHAAAYPEDGCFQWYRHHFSPDERYILSFESHSPTRYIDNDRKRILTVFESKNGAEYNPISSVTVRILLRTNQQENSVLRFLCFHPFQPVIAISMMTAIVIWKFSEKGAHDIIDHKWLILLR